MREGSHVYKPHAKSDDVFYARLRIIDKQGSVPCSGRPPLVMRHNQAEEACHMTHLMR